jgi:hypothetical protein
MNYNFFHYWHLKIIIFKKLMRRVSCLLKLTKIKFCKLNDKLKWKLYASSHTREYLFELVNNILFKE